MEQALIMLLMAESEAKPKKEGEAPPLPKER
jgi:hypothetical protein